MLADNISILTHKGKGGKTTRNNKKFITLCLDVLQAVLKVNEAEQLHSSAKGD